MAAPKQACWSARGELRGGHSLQDMAEEAEATSHPSCRHGGHTPYRLRPPLRPSCRHGGHCLQAEATSRPSCTSQDASSQHLQHDRGSCFQDWFQADPFALLIWPQSPLREPGSPALPASSSAVRFLVPRPGSRHVPSSLQTPWGRRAQGAPPWAEAWSSVVSPSPSLASFPSLSQRPPVLPREAAAPHPSSRSVRGLSLPWWLHTATTLLVSLRVRTGCPLAGTSALSLNSPWVRSVVADLGLQLPGVPFLRGGTQHSTVSRDGAAVERLEGGLHKTRALHPQQGQQK